MSTVPRSNRVTDLLACNDPPLEIEEREFQAIISEGRTQLSALHEQISKTRGLLESLTQQEKQLQSYVQEYQAVTHPMRRLPADILSVIFSLCTDLTTTKQQVRPDNHLRDSLDTNNAPWIFGQVCRRWRSIVLDLSSLWSCLTVSLDKMPTDARPIHLLGRRLRRAGQCPMSVLLRSTKEVRDTHPLLHAIIPYSDQWRDLYVSFPPKSYKTLSCIKGLLSTLQTLHIEISQPKWDSPSGPLDIFLFAPQLHELITTDVADISRMFILPWSQITRYEWKEWEDFPPVDNSHHLATLRLMPSLEICILSCQVPAIPTGPYVIFQLPRLRELHLTDVCGTRGGGVADLLKGFNAPALQMLDSDGYESHENLETLIAFFKRSASPITKLRLQCPDATDEELLQLFRIVPTLEDVDLEFGYSFTNRLIVGLTYPDAKDIDPLQLPLGHKLHTMNFNVTSCDDFDPQLFFEMVESRWLFEEVDDGHPLRELESLEMLYLQSENSPPPSLLTDPRIEKFRKEGLGLWFDCGNDE